MGVSITCFILSFPCLLQKPFIRYGASLSLVSVWPCQDDMHVWQTRLNAGFQVSLVVQSVVAASTIWGCVPGCGLFEGCHLPACNSGAVAFACHSLWFSLGIGFQVGASIMELQAGRGTPNLHPLTNFRAAIRAHQPRLLRHIHGGQLIRQ